MKKVDKKLNTMAQMRRMLLGSQKDRHNVKEVLRLCVSLSCTKELIIKVPIYFSTTGKSCWQLRISRDFQRLNNHWNNSQK